MRIMYATQWFEPEPILKGIGFAKLMATPGHDVRVVTGFPNYPDGRLYPGYRPALFRRGVIDGIMVDRVPLVPSHSRSAIGRAVNYLSFAVSLTIYGLVMRRPDVLYVYHPPLSVGLAAIVIAAVRRIPFVYDIQDLWPDTLAATGMVTSRAVLRIIDVLCGMVYARAGRIIVQSPGFKRVLVERGVPPAKIDVIHNWANDAAVLLSGESGSDGGRKKYSAAFAGRFNIVYAGNMGPSQGIETVLHAAKLVEAVEPRVQFVLVGGGIAADRLSALARDIATRCVQFMPPLPQTEIAALLAEADVLLVHLKDEPLFRITIPSKTQFYLAAGKPILMGVGGDAADLVTTAGAGVVVPSGDAHALANAALRLAGLPREALAAMGTSGRAFYERELCPAVGIARTLAVIEAAVAGRRKGSVARRVFDIAAASAALLIAAPLLPLIAAVVWCDLGSPVLLHQQRPGLNGRPFRLYKFRTMSDARDASGALLPDAGRVSRLGRMLRRLSLDELPQLWNVIRGDMSIVGPRPLLMTYLDRYTPEQARRHEVKPGITGWAQVNGRNAISWEEKLALDIWYVNNRSVELDLKIIGLTIAKVFRREGITAPGYESMPEFLGTRAAQRGDEEPTPL
jgi:lipopolysaccharide/colanic/teichoic acid biosynthesis glycosyltransferase/glycosyltransferase involved in cell wall biosynthesis